ncbi:hypothetical protein [Bradyrhizobium japonicum]|uniref:hypothetical protein n=1 Tax=Bradyrhizobium japonicum TaxID=375 RepID=UPI002714C7D6|nr:hypothetical protein [Bradyrhizobium japonicum]WLB57504.1 hypothetical protein QIH94_16380 [Bradyrhizobium japonicum]WLB60630.1 hypothetical protein QIH96_29570 [Bradyrhizobium japonicum]
MKYNQPYGVSDPDAPYINGNPSTGTMGSIPPAASIEYPQREIVNLIADVSIASPDNGDLRQLGKAIQSQRLNFSTDYGTANAYVARLQPAPDDYYTGMVCRLKVGATNAGDSTLALYPLSPKHVVRPDGKNLQQYDLLKDSVATFVYDGAQWVLSGINAAGSGGPIYLTAALDYYVNGNTGDDTFDGSQAAVGVAPKGPFRTLQRASDAVSKFNLNGFNVTVHVADAANYRQCILPAVAGQGAVLWQGNKVNPGNCLVSCGRNDIQEVCFVAQGVANQISGFKLVGNLGTFGNGIAVPSSTQLIIDNIDWGPCNGTHMIIYNGGTVRLNGTTTDKFTVSGAPLGNTFSGAAWLACFGGGRIDVVNIAAPPQFVVLNTPMNFAGAFIQCSDVAVAAMFFTGGIIGASACTGKKYDVKTNGIINTAGQGINYFPGNVAGTQTSGGQYI